MYKIFYFDNISKLMSLNFGVLNNNATTIHNGVLYLKV